MAESHARPGGQVTGFLWNVQTLPAKQLELLLAAIPGATRIGMLINAGNPLLQKDVEVAAADLGIELIAADVRAAEDLAGAIQKLADRQGARLARFGRRDLRQRAGAANIQSWRRCASQRSMPGVRSSRPANF